MRYNARMTIHPLFVHFPIAFLSVYALMEMVSPFIFQHDWWRNAKRFLIITGWVALIPTIIAGDEALDIIGEFPLSEAHEHAAFITAAIFLVPFSVYLIQLFEETGWGDKIARMSALTRFSWKMKKQVARLLLTNSLPALIALLGFVSLVVTGSLGAAIVHGPEIDPIVSFVYHLLF